MTYRRRNFSIASATAAPQRQQLNLLLWSLSADVTRGVAVEYTCVVRGMAPSAGPLD